MRKLTDYELANLAMWAFDYEQSASLFASVIEQSSEKTDLLGTWGAVEGAIVMRESSTQIWTRIQEEVQQEETAKTHLKRPLAGLIEDRDRVKRFESFISAKEKDIQRNLRRHKFRLRARLAGDLYSASLDSPLSSQLTRKINGPWFVAVQKLVSMCLGRAYRRDGEVPEVQSVQRTLHGTGLALKNSDERCVIINAEGLTVEIWFDGRICCCAPPERFDDVVAVLELTTRVSDSALAVSRA